MPKKKKKKKKLRTTAVMNYKEEVTIQDDMDFTSKPNYTCFSQLFNLKSWAKLALRGEPVPSQDRGPVEGCAFSDPAKILWRVKLFGPGYNVPNNTHHVAVFVECAREQALPLNWHRKVHYRVQVRPFDTPSPFPPTKDDVASREAAESFGAGLEASAVDTAVPPIKNPFPKRGDQHTFTKAGEDRGFWKFLEFNKSKFGLTGPLLRAHRESFYVDVEICDYVPPPSPHDKKIDTTGPECANCTSTVGSSGQPMSKCARCGLVSYCCRSCQMQHWKKGGHRQFCLTPEERSVQASAVSEEAGATGPGGRGDHVCPVCMGPLDNSTTTLPCSHVLHTQCMNELRSFGAKNVCPSCRAELPSISELKDPEDTKCASCGATKSGDSSLRDCSRCKSVSYCGRECQLRHWKEGGHKIDCANILAKQKAAKEEQEEKFMEVVVSTDLACAKLDRHLVPQDFVRVRGINSLTASLNNDPLKTGQHFLTLRKECLVWELLAQIDAEVGVPVSRQRVWGMTSRENGTRRVSDVVVLSCVLGEHVSYLDTFSDAAKFKPGAEGGGDNNGGPMMQQRAANKLHVFLEVLDEVLDEDEGEGSGGGGGGGGEDSPEVAVMVDGKTPQDFAGVRPFTEAREAELSRLYHQRLPVVLVPPLPGEGPQDVEKGAGVAGGNAGAGETVEWSEERVRAAMREYTLMETHALLFFKYYNPLCPRAYATNSLKSPPFLEKCKGGGGGGGGGGGDTGVKPEEAVGKGESDGGAAKETAKREEEQDGWKVRGENDEDEAQVSDELPLRLYESSPPVHGGPSERELCFLGSAYVRRGLVARGDEDEGGRGLDPLYYRHFLPALFGSNGSSGSSGGSGSMMRVVEVLSPNHVDLVNQGRRAGVGGSGATTTRDSDDGGSVDPEMKGATKVARTLDSLEIVDGDLLVFQQPLHGEDYEKGSEEEGGAAVAEAAVEEEEDRTLFGLRKKDKKEGKGLLPLPGTPLPLPAKVKDYLAMRKDRRVIRFYPVSPLEPVVSVASASLLSSASPFPPSTKRTREAKRTRSDAMEFTQGSTGGFDLELAANKFTVKGALFALAHALLTCTTPGQSKAARGLGGGGLAMGGREEGDGFDVGDFHGEEIASSPSSPLFGRAAVLKLANRLRLYCPQPELSSQGHPQPAIAPVPIDNGNMLDYADKLILGRGESFLQIGFNCVFYEVMPFSYDELQRAEVVELVVVGHTHALNFGLDRWRRGLDTDRADTASLLPPPTPPPSENNQNGKSANTEVVGKFRSFLDTDKRSDEKADGSNSRQFLASCSPWQLADMAAGIAALQREAKQPSGGGAAAGEGVGSGSVSDGAVTPANGSGGAVTPADGSGGVGGISDDDDDRHRLPILRTHRDGKGNALRTALYLATDSGLGSGSDGAGGGAGQAKATCVVQMCMLMDDPKISVNSVLSTIRRMLQVPEKGIVTRATGIQFHKLEKWIEDRFDARYHLRRAHASTSHLAGYFSTLDSSGGGSRGGGGSGGGEGSRGALSSQAGGGQYGYGYGGVFGALRVCLEVLEQEHEDEFVRSNVRHGPFLHCYNLPLPGGKVVTARDANFGVQVLLFSLPLSAKQKLALHLQQNKGALPQGNGFGPVVFRGIAHFTWVGPSGGLFEVVRRVQRRLPDWFRLTHCRAAFIAPANMAFYLSEEEALLAPGGGVAVADGDLNRFTGTPFYHRMQHARRHDNIPIIGFEVDEDPRSAAQEKALNTGTPLK